MSASHLHELQRRLKPPLAHGAAVLVTVQQAQGSAPREEGAWMAVFADTVLNTLGGGHLEFDAIALARRCLLEPRAAEATLPQVRRYALGPSLGQCCGGVVHLRFERLEGTLDPDRVDALRPPAHPMALFGGGHVGKALVQLLGTLPMDVLWVDSRDGIFPERVPDNVRCEHSEPVQDAVADLAPGSAVVVMSFSHAEDLDIIHACLKRQRERADLRYIGLIGSRTKWATFSRRLRERGFTDAELGHITCPIGVPGIAGKAPEVVAVAVAAQLLQHTS